MSERKKVIVRAMVPTELEEKFLQHIRDFDSRNDGCHFQIMLPTDKSTKEAEEMLDGIFPPFNKRSVRSNQ